MRDALFLLGKWWRRRRELKPPDQPWEWLNVSGWGGVDQGWVPRWLAEAHGVDCSPLDRTIDNPIVGRLTQGTVWFRKEQSEELRRSRWWLTPEEFEVRTS